VSRAAAIVEQIDVQAVHRASQRLLKQRNGAGDRLANRTEPALDTRALD
jgi:hypothetical protein